MRSFVSTVSILASLLAPTAKASAQDAKVFNASSAWALDYGDDYCRLMRDFSNGDETIGLFIERTQPGPIMRLIVIGDSVRLFRGAEEVGYRMHPSGAPRTTQRLQFRTSDGQQYLNLGPSAFGAMPTPTPGATSALPPPYSRQGEVTLAAKITGIALDRGLTNPVLMETGALGDAVGALQACTDDLVVSWGLDVEKHKNLTRPAMPARPTAGWIATDTIPFDEFSKLTGGNNELRIMVDKAGKATSCHVQWSTLSETINKKICSSVMKQSAFIPALDEAGSQMDSYWTTNVFFLMPPFEGG